MKIGGIYVDSTAFGVLALIVSAISAWFTFRTNREMLRVSKSTAAENRRMADANEGMLAESQRMSEANQRMAVSNEEMVDLTRRMERSAAESAHREAQEALRRDREREEANKARFRFEDGVRRGDGFEAHLINRGPHRAEDPKATVYWRDREIGRGEVKDRVDPGDDLQIAIWANRIEAETPEERQITVRLNYVDGNGPQEKEWTIGFHGSGNRIDWRSEVVSAPEF